MTAARALVPEQDEFQTVVIDEVYLASLPPEIREEIEAADARLAAGTSRLVPHAEVLVSLDRRRAANG
jgi:hypothetical protein